MGGRSYHLFICLSCNWSSMAHQWMPFWKWQLIISEFQLTSPLFKRKAITLKEVHNLIVSTERDLIHARAWTSPKDENVKLQWCAYGELYADDLQHFIQRDYSLVINYNVLPFWIKIFAQLLPRKEKFNNHSAFQTFVFIFVPAVTCQASLSASLTFTPTLSISLGSLWSNWLQYVWHSLE